MSSACCCNVAAPRLSGHWIAGYQDTAAGRVPRVFSRWTWRDRLGAYAVRWGIGRMRYTVPPGLYAVGAPGPDSPLLVSANYKLSFDHVRRAIAGVDVWLLVLDTKGVNVWCAAGKGTFGTDELVGRLAATGAGKVVVHRTLIVPQLGAPGVAAHEVSRRTGFRCVYGPVRTRDLPAFLRDGMRATPDMRRVSFTLRERLAVVPVELVRHFVPALAATAALVLMTGFGSHGSRLSWDRALWVCGAVGANYLFGLIGVPVLLPWLPGRAFAVKGAVVGALLGVALVGCSPWGWQGKGTVALLSVAACSFFGLTFTGSTPYTSASGVRRELRWAIPLQGVAAITGALGWVAAQFV